MIYGTNRALSCHCQISKDGQMIAVTSQAASAGSDTCELTLPADDLQGTYTLKAFFAGDKDFAPLGPSEETTLQVNK